MVDEKVPSKINRFPCTETMSLFSNVFLACVERLSPWCLSSPLLNKPLSRDGTTTLHGCIAELHGSRGVVWQSVRGSVLMHGDGSMSDECDVPSVSNCGLLESSLALVGVTFTLLSVSLHS